MPSKGLNSTSELWHGPKGAGRRDICRICESTQATAFAPSIGEWQADEGGGARADKGQPDEWQPESGNQISGSQASERYGGRLGDTSIGRTTNNILCKDPGFLQGVSQLLSSPTFWAHKAYLRFKVGYGLGSDLSAAFLKQVRFPASRL